jgi:hypothetical protein
MKTTPTQMKPMVIEAYHNSLVFLCLVILQDAAHAIYTRAMQGALKNSQLVKIPDSDNPFLKIYK